MALVVPPGGPKPAFAPAALRRKPAAAAAPRLAVVVVNFFQWRNTTRLAGQLARSDAFAGGGAEIVVVDNHSDPHPAGRQLKRTRGVRVLRSPRNVGFAAAVNRGVAATTAEWVLLLNPDVTAPDGFLDDALAAADRAVAADPNVGVIGLGLRNADGTPQASAGPFPTFFGTLVGLLRPRGRRKCRVAPDAPGPTPWVTGGCLLVRRACFAAAGGFDESFFLYYEDVDFCRRAADLGWSVRCDPAAVVVHHSPLHARSVPAPLRLVTRHALLTYAGKHWRGWQAAAVGRLVWVEAVARERLAARRGDAAAAACFRELRNLVRDRSRGRANDVAARVRYAARFLGPVAAAQDECGG